MSLGRGAATGVVITAVVASLLIGFPAPVAAAPVVRTEGVPPSALSTCSGPASVGGWDDRDQTSDGTDGTNDTFPVRPMIMRLGEPCYLPSDHVNGPDWADSLAYVITDRVAPVPMLDEDEDGEDDGGPPAEVSVCDTGASSTSNLTPPMNTASAFGPGEPVISEDCVAWNIYYDPTGPDGVTNGGYGYITLIDKTGTNTYDIVFNVVRTGGAGFYQFNVNLAMRCLNSTATGFTSTVQTFTIDNQNGSNTQTFNGGTGCNYGMAIAVGNPTGATGATTKWNYVYVGPGDETMDPPLIADGEGYYGGTQAAGARHGNVSVGSTATCSTDYAGTTGISVHTMAGSFEIYGTSIVESDGFWGETRAYTMDLNKSLCPFLQEVTVSICSYVGFGDGESCQTHTWDSDRFRSGTIYPGDDDPTIELCLQYPESPGCYEVLNPGYADGAIVCIIEAEGDFLVWIVTWVSEVPEWLACMVIPEGWDRSDTIYRTFWDGPIGTSTEDFQQALPDSIGCGVIGSIPFMGETVTVDTCSADFAPGWIKSAIGWLIVLGLAVLAIRRVFWAIGGGK